MKIKARIYLQVNISVFCMEKNFQIVLLYTKTALIDIGLIKHCHIIGIINLYYGQNKL
jgi:hypothetical protein